MACDLAPRKMTDAPKEGRLARFLDFTQLVDMASEAVGGKVSQFSGHSRSSVLMARTS
jgi:hypothetical protein